MSAFICNTETFKKLGVFAAQTRYGRPNVDPRYIKHGDLEGSDLSGQTGADLAESIANILFTENVRSVSYRYSNCARNELPGPVDLPDTITITPHEIAVPVSSAQAVQILKSCDCIQYQSCETPDWKDSLAYLVLNSIRKAAIRSLPGYDEADWD